MRYILALNGLLGPITIAHFDCRATPLPIKRLLPQTLPVARLLAATSVALSLFIALAPASPITLQSFP
jgi:hypothetical protein